MALVGVNLKQEQVRECLEAILTQIENYRHNHALSEEAAKRNMNEANNAMDRSAYGRFMDYHQHAGTEFQMLKLEVKQILEHYGITEER